MFRGTTPQIDFTLPFDVSNIKTVWITFSQYDEELFTVKTEDVTSMSGNKIIVKLTQAQTLKLKPQKLLRNDHEVEIQLRILTNAGDALASNIMRTSAEKILKDGEIA